MMRKKFHLEPNVYIKQVGYPILKWEKEPYCMNEGLSIDVVPQIIYLQPMYDRFSRAEFRTIYNFLMSFNDKKIDNYDIGLLVVQLTGISRKELWRDLHDSDLPTENQLRGLQFFLFQKFQYTSMYFIQFTMSHDYKLFLEERQSTSEIYIFGGWLVRTFQSNGHYKCLLCQVMIISVFFVKKVFFFSQNKFKQTHSKRSSICS